MNYIAKLRQKKSYDTIKTEFLSSYENLKSCEISNFTQPFWAENNQKLEELFTPYPPFNFLENQIIKGTMFVDARGNWLDEEVKFLEQNGDKNKIRSAREDYLGTPATLSIGSLRTSHNSIHHLYHLVRYENETGTNLREIDSMVEWGGGYGNLVKILSRILNKPFTYTIIDTPLFSCLQYIYLKTTLGKDAVNLIRSEDDRIEPQRINLLPLCFINNFDLDADIFISTWGLSESSKFSQDFVLDKKWFGAERLLIGFQDNTAELPTAERLGEMAKSEGAKIIDIEFLENNHYAFK